MAKKKKSQVINDAKKYYKLLLWEATGGSLGSEPEAAPNGKKSDATFAEKRGLLDSLIKIAQLEAKGNEGFEDESGFEKIRKDIYASRENGRAGNLGGTESEGGSDDAGASSEDADLV
jgi:hypothetical protein